MLGTTTRGLPLRVALALLVVGVGLTTIANSRWAHAIGVIALLLFVALAFPSALPPEIRSTESARRRPG